MRLLAIIFILMGVQANAFFLDEDITKSDLKELIVYVAIQDNAKDACWTNLRFKPNIRQQMCHQPSKSYTTSS